MNRENVIYRLLPSLYRRRDTSGALRALTGVLDDARQTIERDIERLHADWVVDSCTPAALPLLAHLVGVDAVPADADDPRGLVAEAIALARRKGTAGAVQRALTLLTGWPVSVSSHDGAATIAVWTDPVCRLRSVAPRAVEGGGAGCYTLHPLGIDTALLVAPRPFAGLDRLSDPALDAPIALRRDDDPARVLRSVQIDVQDADGAWRRLGPDEIVVGDLSAWSMPAARTMIDPELGRLCIAEPPPRIAVSFSYHSPGAIGGGGYARPFAVVPDGAWHATVIHGASEDGTTFGTLAAALAAWRAVPGDAVIQLLDGGTHDVGTLAIDDAMAVCPADPNARRRLVIAVAPGDVAVLRGDLDIVAREIGLDVVLSGLWIDGGIAVSGAAALQLDHCTTVAAPISQALATVRADRSILGGDTADHVDMTAMRRELLLRALPDLLPIGVLHEVIWR